MPTDARSYTQENAIECNIQYLASTDIPYDTTAADSICWYV